MTASRHRPGVFPSPLPGTVLSGLLLFLAQPPSPFPLLVLVALVPVLAGASRWRSTREAAGVGALLFGVFWGLNLSWVLLLPIRLGVLWPVPAYLGQLLLLTLMGAAFGAGLQRIRGAGMIPLALAAPLAWVAVEWGRGTLLGPLRFPWSGIALPLAGHPTLLQPASAGGESLLAFGVVAVNGLLAESWRRGRRVTGGWEAGSRGRGTAWRPAAGAVALMTLWVGFGWWRIAALRDAAVPVVTARAVQPAIPLAVKRDPGRSLEEAVEALGRWVTPSDSAISGVVVFPETHLPVLVAGEGGISPEALEAARSRGVEPLSPTLQEGLREVARAAGGELLVGGWFAGPGGVENALLRITGEGVVERYAKVGLVPGVEWVPGGGLAPGPPPAPMRAPGAPGPLICIESAWGGLARSHARNGAGWLLNVTNDAWLGESPRWTRTPAFHQHPLHLAIRSAETGLGAFRVANNGWTGVVTPLGGWQPLLAPHQPGSAVAVVHRLPAPTLHLRIGEWLGPFSFALVLGVWLMGFVGSRWGRGRKPLAPPR